LTLDDAVAKGEQIAFTGTSEVLVLGDSTQFEGKVEHFAAGDTIDLSSVARSAIIGENFAKGVLTLTESTG